MNGLREVANAWKINPASIACWIALLVVWWTSIEPFLPSRWNLAVALKSKYCNWYIATNLTGKNSKESQKSHVCPMWRCVLSSNFNYLGPPEQNTMSGMSLKNFLSDFSLMITPLVIKGSLHSEIRSCVQTSITRRKKTSCLHSNKQVMNLAGDAPFSHFMAFKSPESRSIWMISSRRNFLIKGKENLSWDD